MNHEQLRSTVQEAFVLGKDGNADAATRLLCSLIPDFTADEITRVCIEVDTNREVFDVPAPKGQKGLYGFDQYHDRYHCCSDLYGHRFFAYRDAEENTAQQAIEEAYEDGDLAGNGHMVYDLVNKRYGFLVQIALDGSQIPEMALFAELENRFAVKIEGIAFPKEPICSAYPSPASASIVCFITDMSRLNIVGDLAVEMQQITNRW